MNDLKKIERKNAIITNTHLNCEEERSLTLKEAAEELGVSENTMWRWEKVGYLVPVSHVGRRAVYLQSQIDELMKRIH